MKYRVLFIDEEKDYHDYFEDYIEYQKISDIEPIVAYPKQSLQEMIDLVFDISADVVVSDYRLNDIRLDIKHNVPYDGLELIENITKIRAGFPCFVMTAFDTDAVENSHDVNIVYDKSVLLNPGLEDTKAVKFVTKVLKQVDHYRKMLDEAEKELCELIEKRHLGKATIDDEGRIIELDELLERAIDQRGGIPSELKQLSNQNRLAELIRKADEILGKYEAIS
jgi:DNA-binding NtrC family response regulator